MDDEKGFPVDGCADGKEGVKLSISSVAGGNGTLVGSLKMTDVHTGFSRGSTFRARVAQNLRWARS
jgi:hypothetical protein